MSWTYTLEQLAGISGASRDGLGPHAAAAFHAVSTDTRTLRTGEVFFALSGERFDGNRFVEDALAKGAVAAVTTIPRDDGRALVVADPLAALQAFAAHHRAQFRLPLLALTGSCGKTTTKDLTSAVLSTRLRVVKTPGNLNNDIGCPLSLLGIDGQTDMAVIEMGANHLGEVARLCQWARPTESAVTLVAPAHLEGFGAIENVAQAKGEIAEALPADGVFYVNTDDPWCVRIAQSFPGRKIRFGSTGDVVLERFQMDESGDMRLYVGPVGALRLPVRSRAYVTNVLLAIAVGIEHGIDTFEEPLRVALASTSRGAILRVGPLEIIDDTYNANPASMAAALDALASRPGAGARFAALGDMLELGDSAASLHRELGRQAAQSGVARLLVFGQHAHDVVEGARAAGIAHAAALDSHEAVAAAIQTIARPGDALLVKGSRGMRMERVIEALERRYGVERR